MSSTEAQFLENADFEKYQGKWVAILDKKIIVIGDTMSEAYEKSISVSSGRTPLFQRIPKKGEIHTFLM